MSHEKSKKEQELDEILKDRIMILDGAMGTMIQQYPLEEEDFRNEDLKDKKGDMKGNNDILSLTRPDIVKEIHEKWLDAGADIIETNTFSGTTIAQADYNCEEVIHELNKVSAEIAREKADEYTEKDPSKPRFVTGVLGPTNKTASISPDVNDPGYRAINFDQLAQAYKEQTVGLIEGGVDMLLVETVFDTLNCKAALYGIREHFDEIGYELPIMVSGTITDQSGRTLSGQTPSAFWYSNLHAGLFSIGLNCALGAKDLRPYLKELAYKADIYTSAHPNAGLPNEFGEYDQSAEEMADEVEEFLQEGFLNIIGGCCGTTPEHIAEIAKRAEKYSPRPVEKVREAISKGETVENLV